MKRIRKVRKLKKGLGLFSVYAIATGTTLSAGFFLLPGLAAESAGPAMILSYALAAVPLIPAMFSIIELSTAMPRAGGIYYFLDRALGPMFGTIGGLGTWLALVLKVSFALVGMGAYISIFFEGAPATLISVALALVIGVLNIYGAKNSGRFQVALVIGLLALLGVYIVAGAFEVNFARFEGFFDAGSSGIIYTTGLVYISYVGVTNVASLSEEVRNPEKNLPLGIILAMGTAVLIYALGIGVMVGVAPVSELAGNLTPVATAAEKIFGKAGALLLSIAAILAFVSVANAGAMSASRYPLAMSRDNLLPHIFRRVSKRGVPAISIILTIGIVIAILLTFNPIGIAKLASSFQLLMFALACIAVIVIRESGLKNYDPGLKSPLYPWMQLFGVIVSFYLIVELGLMPMLFSLGLIIIGIIWYKYYVGPHFKRAGAIFHVFEKWGKERNEMIEFELRDILKEKGLRKEDPFDEIILRSIIIDTKGPAKYDDIAKEAAEKLCRNVLIPSEKLYAEFTKNIRSGAAPVTHGIALPHVRMDTIARPEMVIARSVSGIKIEHFNPLSDNEGLETAYVHAIFFLASPEEPATQHLRILAQLAGIVEDESFLGDWLSANYSQQLKEILLRDERFLTLTVRPDDSSGKMAGKPVRALNIPHGCLVAMLRRHGVTIVPHGDTVIQAGDRLTVIGEPACLKEFTAMMKMP